MAADSPRALYPGTFDPFTLGHLDLIRRGLEVFGTVRVGLAVNESKTPLFPIEERLEMIREELADFPEVEVQAFQGLVVDYCSAEGIRVILRGVRTVTDFEYEYQMALTNRVLDGAIETVFMMPNERYSFVSSRLIREVYAAGGDLRRFLSPAIHERVTARLRKP